MSREWWTDLDASNLESFKEIDEVVCIGYIATDDVMARNVFSAAAEKYRGEFTFGLVSDANLIQDQNLESRTLTCRVAADDETRTLSSFSEAADVERFVVESTRAVIGELMPYNQNRLLDVSSIIACFYRGADGSNMENSRQRGWPMVYVFAETEDDRAELRRSLHKFAKGYYDALTCVTVDPLEFPDLQATLGLESGVLPSGAVHQLSKDRIYPYPAGLPLESKSLQKWGLDVWQGRIKPWTPPGATTVHEDVAPTKAATRKVSIANIPGLKVRIAGRDEL